MHFTVVKKCTALENISHTVPTLLYWSNDITMVDSMANIMWWIENHCRCHIRLAMHNLCHVFAHVVLKKLDCTIWISSFCYLYYKTYLPFGGIIYNEI